MRVIAALLLFALALVLAVFELSPHGFTWIDHAGPFGSVDQWGAHITGLVVIVLLVTTARNVQRRRLGSDEVNAQPDWHATDEYVGGSDDSSSGSQD